MRLLPVLFIWLWVPVTYWGWQTSSGPERAVAFFWFTAMSWGASTWTLWRVGFLRWVFGPSDLSKRLAKMAKEVIDALLPQAQVQVGPPAEKCSCGLLKVAGVDHSKCGG